jgi:hypothetical protein
MIGLLLVSDGDKTQGNDVAAQHLSSDAVTGPGDVRIPGHPMHQPAVFAHHERDDARSTELSDGRAAFAEIPARLLVGVHATISFGQVPGM